MTISTTPKLNAMPDVASGKWLVINDGVMGGNSHGAAIPTSTGVRFAGELSLDNNGGFSSARMLLDKPPRVSGGLWLVLKGDGRVYQARLREGRNLDGVAWRASFSTTGEWQELEIPFSEFEPVFRGRPVPDAGPVDPARIRELGVLIADGRAGPFSLEIRNIGLYGLQLR